MVQVNVAIMLAPVTFLGYITSQPVEAMARMQTDRVSHHILHATLNGSMLLLRSVAAALCCCCSWSSVMQKAVEQQSALQEPEHEMLHAVALAACQSISTHKCPEHALSLSVNVQIELLCSVKSVST
jgi:hypothetical protein